MEPGNLLLVDDEEKLRSLLKRILQLENFTVFEASDLKNARKIAEKESIDVILCDVKLPDGNGIEFIPILKSLLPDAEIILLTAYGNIEGGVQAMKNGAYDYITKGDDNDRVIPLVNRALEKVRMGRRINRLEERVGKKYAFDSVLGDSPAVQDALALARKVAPAEATVLLLGETGTGKEVFAQAIHQGSKRASGAFVALNCSAFSPNLMESELFGYRAGAFTGAGKDKKGILEEAHEGTLFLDEIGEMPVELQAKLLRVLETGEFIKVGDTRPGRVNVRIIAATNRPLDAEVAAGRFREDLFYRLNTVTIAIPALRDRPGDIPVLATHFLQVFAQKSNPAVAGMSPGFVAALKKHCWKGNIRELKNILERAVILCAGDTLTEDLLPVDFLDAAEPGGAVSAFDLASMEKLHIQRVLNHTQGNKTAAARLLNIGLTTLYRKLEEYHIQDTGH